MEAVIKLMQVGDMWQMMDGRAKGRREANNGACQEAVVEELPQQPTKSRARQSADWRTQRDISGSGRKCLSFAHAENNSMK